MAQTIYQKYRPKKFSEISGQDYIVKILSNSIVNKRIANAYLFTGSHGTGKTTLARIFSKTINCLDPQKQNGDIKIEPCNKCENCKLIAANQAIDLNEIDAASHTGVDNIRQLKENVFTPPVALKYKVYIIDEVHMLSIGAFNALLKILEEPPSHAIFILATTEIHKLPDTIISRCQRFDFQKLSQKQVVKRLDQLAKKEKIEIEKLALENIALESEGGMRDAESLLGQIIAFKNKNITAKDVNQIIGLSSRKNVLDFVQNLLEGKTKECLEMINKLQRQGSSLKNFNKIILHFLRNIILEKVGRDEKDNGEFNISPEQKKIIQKLAEKTSYQDLLSASKLFQKNISLFKETSILQLPLELAVIEFYLHQNPSENKVTEEENMPTNNKIIKNSPKITNPETKTEKVSQEENSENIPTKNEAPEEESLKSEVKNNNVSIELESVLDNWSKILEDVKPFNHSIHAFLKNCSPVALKDGKLYIKTKYDFYKARLNEPSNRLTIKKVIDKILSCNLQVEICTDKEAARMKLENNSKGKNHNVLHDAMQMMGGRIVE